MLVATWTGLGRTWRHGPKPKMRWTRSWLDRMPYILHLRSDGARRWRSADIFYFYFLFFF